MYCDAISYPGPVYFLLMALINGQLTSDESDVLVVFFPGKQLIQRT